MWFEPDLLPGYAWSFPIAGGVANVGFGILRGTGYKVADMGAVWRELLARPHIRAFLGPEARPRRRTGPGRSPPGSIGWCCRRGGRSSWATPRRPATR